MVLWYRHLYDFGLYQFPLRIEKTLQKKGGIAKRYTPTTSGNQEMVYINEPNLYRLIIKSRKSEAEPFEEVLPQIRKTGKYSLEPKQLASPEKKYPFNLTEQDLQTIAWDWFALLKCVESTSYLIPALESIQSKFTAQAHSIVSEYGSMLRIHQPLIQKFTADFKVEMWSDENWNRVLPTIRDNDVLQPKRRLSKF